MQKTIYTILLLIAASTACQSDKETSARLQQAEELMNEAPDSALLLLRNMDPATLDSRKLRARHALLHAQALDKNGIDLSTDSVIAPAAAYYARHGSKRERAYMNYYLGRIRNNAGDLGEAARLMLEAEKYAPADESYLLGLIYNCRANLHYAQYSLDEALGMYEKADSCFRQVGNIMFSGYMSKAKAKTYTLKQNSDAAISEFEKAFKIFDSLGNHQQACLIASSIAYQMKKKEDFPLATIKNLLQSTYAKHNSGTIPAIDYPLWSGIYLQEDKIDSAKFFGNLALQAEQKYSNKRCGVLTFLSQIEERTENYKQATQHWKEAYALLDSASYAEKEQLIQRIEIRYKNKELQQRNEMLHMRNRYLIIIGLLVLALTTTGFSVALRYWKRVARKRMLQNMRNQIFIEKLNEDQSGLQLRYQQMEQELHDGSEESARLLTSIESRLDEIMHLLDYAYSNTCNPKDLHQALKEYAHTINADEFAFSELRYVVNKRYGGILDYLRVRHQSLSNSDINLIGMLMLHFTFDSIRLIYNHENTDTLYSRRTKIREKMKLPRNYKVEDYVFWIGEQLKNGEAPDEPLDFARKNPIKRKSKR